MRQRDDERSLLDEDDPLRDRPERLPRRGARIWPRTVLVVVLVLLVIVSLLPRLASTAPVRRLVLGKINAGRAPATLDVESWSLRWFGHQTVGGVHYADSRQGLDAQVVKITLTRGLIGMLPLGGLNLGVIELDRPQVTLRLPGREAPPTEEGNEAAPPAPPKRNAAPPVSDLALTLVMKGGRVELTGAGPKPFLLENIALRVPVSSLKRAIPVAFAAFVPWGDDAGRIAVDGTLPAPTALMAGGPPTQERLTLRVDNLDLQGFRCLLENLSGQPWVRSGVANGSVSIDYRGREAAHLQADLAVANLSVEPPDKPASPAGAVRVQADVSYADGQLTIGQLAASSPWAGVKAEGKIAVQPDEHGRRLGGVDATVDADIAAIARDFGSLFKLDPNFRAESGRVKLTAVLSGTADALEGLVDMSSSDLAMRSGNERLVLQPPPSIHINARLPYDKPASLIEVRELAVALPFARIGGKGRLDEASFKADVDLAALARDARRIVPSCPELSGSLVAEGRSRNENDRLTANVQVTVNGISARLSQGTRLALSQGRLTVAAQAPLANGVPRPELDEFTLSLDSSLGTLSGSADRIVAGSSNQAPAIVGGRFKTEVDLKTALDFAAPFLGFLPTNAVIHGKLASNATAEMAGGAAKVRLNTVAQDVQVTTTAWDAREPDVRLKLAVDLDGAKGQMRVFDTHLESALATFDVADLRAQLPKDGETLGMRGGIMGSVSLATLGGWMRPGRNGQPPPRLQGKVAFQVQGTTDPGGVGIGANVVLDQFSLASGTNRPFAEPHAELALKASLPVDASRLTIDACKLKTSLADLDATGRIDDPAGRRLADLKGSVGIDFDNVNTLLRAQGIAYPVVSGKQLRPFAVSGPFGGGLPAIFSYGKADATIFIGTLGAFGLTAGPADASFAMKDGVARVHYGPALNQGKLDLSPIVELTTEPRVLSLPPKTPLLQNVQLTQEMLDQALVYVVPLLRGSSVLGGTIDLAVQECRVPMGPTLKKDTTFNLTLTLHNVRLAPTGTIGTILELAGQTGHEINIQQYTITADCKDGRVKPSPLEFKVAGNRVTLAGTVGLDGTLAYTASVPLSRTLVGPEVAKYFGGAIVNVPITGTVKSPAYDRKAVNAEVRRLVKEAAAKAVFDVGGGLLNNLRR